MSSFKWFEDAESYLLSKGWKKVGTDNRNLPRFLDPKGVAGGSTGTHKVTKRINGKEVEVWEHDREREIKVKNRDGEVVTWKQVQGLPIAWEYGIEEANEIQRSRDAEEASKTAKEAAANEPAKPKIPAPGQGSKKVS